MARCLNRCPALWAVGLLLVGLSWPVAAETLLERIIGEVKAFAGNTPQGDDMTVVVLQVEA